MTTPATVQKIDTLADVRAGDKGDTLILAVLARDDETAWKPFRNLGERVGTVSPEEPNTYDALVADRVIFTSATLATLAARGGGAG